MASTTTPSVVSTTAATPPSAPSRRSTDGVTGEHHGSPPLDVPLKDRPSSVDTVREVSDTIYFRGVSPKLLSDEQVVEILNYFVPAVEIDVSERRSAGSGSVWAKYASVGDAGEVLLQLHKLQFQGYFQGLGLIASFELGLNPEYEDEAFDVDAHAADVDEERREKLKKSRRPRLAVSISYNPVLRRVQPLAQKQLPNLSDWLADRGAGKLDVTGRAKINVRANKTPPSQTAEGTSSQDGLVYAFEETGGKLTSAAASTTANKKKKQQDAPEKKVFPTISVAASATPSASSASVTPQKLSDANMLAKSVSCHSVSSSTTASPVLEGEANEGEITPVEKMKPPPLVKMTNEKSFAWGFHADDGEIANYEEESWHQNRTKEILGVKSKEELKGKLRNERKVAFKEASRQLKAEGVDFGLGKTASLHTKADRLAQEEVPPGAGVGGGDIDVKVGRSGSTTAAAPQAEAQEQADAGGKGARRGEATVAPPAAFRQLVKNPQVALYKVQDCQFQQKAMVINKQTKYPMPSGVYLSRVLRVSRKVFFATSEDAGEQQDEQNVQGQAGELLHQRTLLSRISDVDLLGGLRSYDKELSESMAMVDAVERALRLFVYAAPTSLEEVKVFVIGDGKHALTACCLRAFLEGGTKRKCESSGTRSASSASGAAGSSAAASGVGVSSTWHYFSVDPIMEASAKLEAIGNLHQRRLLSQEFLIPEELRKVGCSEEECARFEDAASAVDEALCCCEDAGGTVGGRGKISLGGRRPGGPLSSDSLVLGGDSAVASSSFCSLPQVRTATSQGKSLPLSIVVACHSHAPLKEFWGRVPGPKICATLPCCEHYSDLGRTPDLQYDDFEVFTPKRRVRLYKEL
eukprot:g11562.t1